jgi:uncharacterized membrane protein YeaQ/YmgE (transglycosylase-associated protein family)
VNEHDSPPPAPCGDRALRRPAWKTDLPQTAIRSCLESVMGVIAWIILGLVAGMVAKMLVPGRDPQGLIITTLIGIAGALLGGFLATKLFHVNGTQGFFDLSTWISAIAGAAVLLLAYHLVTGQSSSRRFGGRRSGRWAGRR